MKQSLPVGRNSSVSLAVVVLVAGLWPAPATHATPIAFEAPLGGANEMPAPPPQGAGQAAVVLDAAAQTIQINVTFSGLTSNDVAAHIHCCLPSPLAAMNVGVATTVPAFVGFPL